MKQTFLNEILQKQLCGSKDKILLAVSGGIDSMVMLHLFKESGFTIGVAHANFQLRGVASDEDEQFVKAICEKNAVPFFVKRFETEIFSKSNHVSIQMAARELRYGWFNALLAEQQYDLVATAHHLNDSIETVLLNLVRGTGMEGLEGIAQKNEKVIRPMLWATRHKIEQYARENKIQWREDQSNASDDYARNFIRHHVYPLLKELNPALEKTAAESSAKISGTVELMTWGAERWKEKFAHKKGDQVLLDKKGFAVLTHPEGVLWNLIKGFGFNVDQCRQVVAALDGQPGKFFSSSQFALVIDRDQLIISKNQGELTETLIQMDQTGSSLGNLMMDIKRKEKAEFTHDPSVGVLDGARLKFPLRWRKWRAGDFFYPLGMTQKKKISDFLIDEKISLADKGTTTVLESGGEIVWVVGMRLDDRYKVTDATQSTIICRLSTAR